MDAVMSAYPKALSGDPEAISALVMGFTPVVQARAVRALVRRGRGRDARQELEDMTQEVLCLLFRDDARILRAWDPARGLSLLNFIGLVAEREAARILSSDRRSPWALEPTEEGALERAAGTTEGLEPLVASRQIIDLMYQRLVRDLSPKAIELFRLLVVEEHPVEEVIAFTGLEAGVLYTWRSRLLKRARLLLDEIEHEQVTDSGAHLTSPRGGVSP
jgi:hypothetical protein